MSDWITSPEAADILCVTRHYVLRLRRTMPDLVRWRPGPRQRGRRPFLFSRADCEALMQLRRQHTCPLMEAARIVRGEE